MPDTRWIVPIRCAPADRVRLYCFHHAGGSALSFGAWPRALPEGISIFAVQLPGRDGSPPVPAASRVQDLVPALMEAWAATGAGAAGPFVFYGHSLGALVAFELTRALRRAGRPQPAALFVSGRRAPHCPLVRTALSDLPDAALLRTLEEMGGMPSPLMENDKWRAFFLQILRRDLRLSDRYRYTAEARLHVPVHAFRGEHDPVLAHEELTAWRHETAGEFSAEMLPGTHFFNEAGLGRLRVRLAGALLPLVDREGGYRSPQPDQPPPGDRDAAAG